MKSGHIYLLKNPAYRANYHKLGKTEDTTEKRSRKLSQPTGVPAEFIIVYQHHVPDCHRAESLAKERLKDYRVADTEFFDIAQNEVIKIMMEVVETMNKLGADTQDTQDHPYADNFLRQICELFETSRVARMSSDEFKLRVCYLTSWRYWRESFTLAEFCQRTGLPEHRVTEILKAIGTRTEEEIDKRDRTLEEEVLREIESEL